MLYNKIIYIYIYIHMVYVYIYIYTYTIPIDLFVHRFCLQNPAAPRLRQARQPGPLTPRHGLVLASLQLGRLQELGHGRNNGGLAVSNAPRCIKKAERHGRNGEKLENSTFLKDLNSDVSSFFSVYYTLVHNFSWIFLVYENYENPHIILSV